LLVPLLEAVVVSVPDMAPNMAFVLGTVIAVRTGELRIFATLVLGVSIKPSFPTVCFPAGVADEERT